MPKTIRKTIRFTEKEWEKVEEKISQANIDFSTFARSAIFRRKIVTENNKKVLAELSRIGNNLNQLVRIANTHLKQHKRIPILKLLVELEKEIKRVSRC